MSNLMNLDVLLQQFHIEIAGQYCFKDENLNITNPQVLSWYRERDNRPLYVDYSLCSASIVFSGEPKYLLGIMARNPNLDRNNVWHASRLIDGGGSWFNLFSSPLTKERALFSLKRFTNEPRHSWIRYDSFDDSVAWSKLLKKL